ncbi:MAG: hypothetical protein A2Y15_01245 [Clostridiales bacterium GWF2_36_10]|nr:MAG: hypothetical protein A2Y15_01245 [Clostridiales bacterium GWF2_36_10]HAN22027.1 hypothetical protein [Clostridiales bacterium]
MDYRDFAKDLLKRKNQLSVAHETLKNEIEELEREKYSCKTASLNSVPVSGNGSSKYEDRLITIIALLDDCRFRLRVVERELKMIEQGFSGLNDYQTQLLEGFFIHETKGAAESLMSRFYKERSCLYADRNKALEAFTRSVYGIVLI